jgi:pimeloyl-ACP methyl ester carboxylesterase
MLYARVRYGIDLEAAAPEAVLRGVRVPVLLIHGSADDNIPPAHSVTLLAANPGSVTLWRVPGAGHTAALGANPEEFSRRVLGWLESPRPTPGP